MKTAEEIFHSMRDEQGKFKTQHHIRDIINTARKEAIEECAKVATTKIITADDLSPNITIDRQSILKLIDELK